MKNKKSEATQSFWVYVIVAVLIILVALIIIGITNDNIQLALSKFSGFKYG
jgi:uncharacterized Tic20 family protein